MNRFILRTEEFLKSTLGGAVLYLFMTTCVGSAVTFTFAQMQAKAAADQETRKAASANRIELVNSVTRMLSERKTHAGLVISAIRHRASSDDVKARWKAYEGAYTVYNTNLFKYKASAGMLMGLEIGQKLSTPFDDYLTPSFNRIDTCVTEGFYKYTAGDADGAITALDRCQVKSRAKPFDVSSEMVSLQTCIGTYDNVLLTSIIVENEFDQLSVEKKRQFSFRKAIKDKGKDELTLECGDGDVLCRRIASVSGLSRRINEGCKKLGARA